MQKRTLLAAALLAALLFALGSPRLASGQLASQERAEGLPAGLDLPVESAAVAEEPSAISVNPAGLGFLFGPALQYFHETASGLRTDADGIYLADRLGKLAFGYSSEWLRPTGLLSRYRRSQFALALTDGHAVSLGGGLTFVDSSNGALERARSFDAGLTLRPLRTLSLAATALGQGAHLGDKRLPVRFDLAAAARLFKDRLTVSADLLADDEGQPFRAERARLGVLAEIFSGLAAGATLDLKLPGENRDKPGNAALLTLTWNEPHAGITLGATRSGDDTHGILGVRLSEESYPSFGNEGNLVAIDLPKALEPERLLFFTVGDRDPYGRLVEELLQARDDPEVGALLLRIDSAPLGPGRVEELRELLTRIREKKPVLAYLLGGGTREYWLASAATAVAAPPGAPLLVNGFASAQFYYRDLLSRIGVAVDVVRAGAYKSATEPLVRTGPSPEAAQMENALLDDTYDEFVAEVAFARHIPPTSVRALVDTGLFTSDEAKKAGLLDATPWPDELSDWASTVAGRKLHATGPYRKGPLREAERWGRPTVVEVIRLAGIITGGGSEDLWGDDPFAGASAVTLALHRAADDPDVRAVVLRIESPGGDGLASDLIWREVVRTRRLGKPVVASLGDVAASGGYLAAAGADLIVAEPSTLTGSIGVFAAKPDLSGLLERLSVHREAFARGEKADALSLMHPFTPAERATLQHQIDAFYSLFLDRVAEGRHLSRELVEASASGQVFTGRQALERHLIDRLGTLADAIALAESEAGLKSDEAVLVRREGAFTSRGLFLAALAPRAEESSLATLWRAAPELKPLLLLAEGRLGPLLALPEEWLAREPR